METIPIPGPPGLPLVGNIGDVDTKDLVMSIRKLADTYGMSLIPLEFPS
jgi:cytochrome P450/NADPH-cytochrome P450 reductase